MNKWMVSRSEMFLVLGSTAVGCLMLGCPTTAMPDAASGSDAQASDAVGASDAADALTAGDAPMPVDAFVAPDAPGTIAIAGMYTDGFGTHTVSSARWEMGGGFTAGFAISRFDNAEGYALAQNDATNMFSPSAWSRFEWFRVGATLYMCQGPFDAVSEAAAMTAPRADRSDPAMTGCGGNFPWSVLTSL